MLYEIFIIIIIIIIITIIIIIIITITGGDEKYINHYPGVS